MSRIDELAAECRRRLAADSRRRLLGLTGVPGSGKSTLAARLADALNASLAPADPDAPAAAAPPPVRVLPMDGFHLTNAELDARNLRHRKGSPPTFDAGRFAAVLHRLRQQPDRTVTAPLYSRDRHEPIPGALTLSPETRLIIVEGNYLLLDQPPWDRIQPLLDEAWFLDVPIEIALQRVHDRHRRGGSTPSEADQKIGANDRPNAELVHATRPRADRIIEPTA